MINSMKFTAKTMGIVAAAIVLLAVGGLLLWTLSNQRVYGVVGNHKITQRELDQTLKGSIAVSQDKAVTTLLDRWLNEQIGKSNGLVVTAAELTTELGRRGIRSPQAPNYNFVTVAATRDLYAQKLKAKLGGSVKGRFVIAHFDHYIVSDETPPLPDNPIAGRDQRIAADRAYAESFINGLYAKLMAHQITFDQAITMENNDPKIGVKAEPTVQHSGIFDTTSPYASGTGFVTAGDADDQLDELAVGGFSKPFVVKAAVSVQPGVPEVEAWFMMIMLDARQTKSGQDYNQMIASQKTKLGYKKY